MERDGALREIPPELPPPPSFPAPPTPGSSNGNGWPTRHPWLMGALCALAFAAVAAASDVAMSAGERASAAIGLAVVATPVFGLIARVISVARRRRARREAKRRPSLDQVRVWAPLPTGPPPVPSPP